MKTWLYQLDAKKWSPNLFRCAIWEGRQWQWNRKRSRPADAVPDPGDALLFFYTMGTKEPGIYGWGIIDRCEDFGDDKMLNFTPTAPTNHLKVDPWWDTECERIVTEIRPMPNAGTLLEVPENLVPQIRRGIKRWVYHAGGEAI